MKKIFLVFTIVCICKINNAQNQNTSPYPPPTVTPGNQLPTQSNPPYNPPNPSGMPNAGYTVSTPPNVLPVDPFVNRKEEYSTSPGTVTPATPTTNITPKQFQSLLDQDPMRTPEDLKLKTAGNVNGSDGKYVSEHKQPKNDFTKRKHHIKKSKTQATETQGKSYTATK